MAALSMPPLDADSLLARATALAPAFLALSDEIWRHAELGFDEHRSAAGQAALLARHGFRVSGGVAGLATAFVAECGEGGPTLGFLGEFDALPGLSQQAGVAVPQPVAAGAAGHGCGHNLLGVGGMLAAVTLAGAARDAGLPVRIRYVACPAEEGGFGKGLMVRAGVFGGLDAVIGWHPGTFNGVRFRATLAVLNRCYAFTGRAAHAAMAPWQGRSALDALELMNIGVNFLREHMPPDARVHYAITDAGGAAPGVVQAHAAADYMIRARSMAEAADLASRVDDIARGAALMTGTEVAISAAGGASNVLPNRVLAKVMQQAFAQVGAPQPPPDGAAFAAAIATTTGADPAAPLDTGLRPLAPEPGLSHGSTDVGDVSWQVPVVEGAAATWVQGTPSHSWQVVAQGCSPYAHGAMVTAAAAMAGTGLALLRAPATLAAARAELDQRRAGQAYLSPFERLSQD